MLQNKVSMLLVDADYATPTVDLLEATDSLSVQQMIAYQTAVTAKRIIKSKKPSYLAKKLKVKDTGMSLRGRQGSVGTVQTFFIY